MFIDQILVIYSNVFFDLIIIETTFVFTINHIYKTKIYK